MKKVFFIALAAFALFSCNKELTNVEDGSLSQPLKYVFNVAEKASFDGDTRAVKTSWENGDKIYINFDDAMPEELTDLTVLTFNGTAWEVTEGKGPAGTSGTLEALYYDNPSPRLVKLGGDGSNIKLGFSNVVPDWGKYMFLMNNKDIPYSIEDGVLTASISLDFVQNNVRTYTQFCITGLSGDDWWFVSEDRVHPVDDLGTVGNDIGVWVPQWNPVRKRFDQEDSRNLSERTSFRLNIHPDGSYYFYCSCAQLENEITLSLVKGAGVNAVEYRKTFSKKISGKCAAITFSGPQLDGNGVPTNGWTRVN